MTAGAATGRRRDSWRRQRVGTYLSGAISLVIHGVAIAAFLIYTAARPPSAQLMRPQSAQIVTVNIVTDSHSPEQPAATAPAQRSPSARRPRAAARAPTAPLESESVPVQAAPSAPAATPTNTSEAPDVAGPAVTAAISPARELAAASSAVAPTQPSTVPASAAAYLYNPAPAYPELSRRLREEGKVVLRVEIAPDGVPTVVAIETSSGNARLDTAAIAAVRQWRFVPARQATTAVAASVLIPVIFRLNT